MAQLVIRLQDVNTHAPQFRPREYTLALTSDTHAGDPLARVHAFDTDVGDHVLYALGPGIGAELFELDSHDGVLRLHADGARKLSSMDDARDAAFHGLELRVEARDTGGRRSGEMVKYYNFKEYS